MKFMLYHLLQNKFYITLMLTIVRDNSQYSEPKGVTTCLDGVLVFDYSSINCLNLHRSRPGQVMGSRTALSQQNLRAAMRFIIVSVGK